MSDIDIRHLCNLAQLDLSAEESAVVAGDLARIIEMVDQMQAINTEGVEPLAHPLDSASSLRPDTVTETVDRARYQQGAPETESGFYLVPKVIE